MKKFRGAIVGLGHSAEWHVNAMKTLNRQFELLGGFDLNRNTSGVLGEDCIFYSSFEELVGAKPDFVVVTVPSKFRYEYIKKLLDIGINVFAEKPFVDNLEDYIDLESDAAQGRLIIHGAFHAQFASTVVWVSNLLKRTEVGTGYPSVGKLKKIIFNRFDPYVLDRKVTGAPEMSSGLDSLPNILSELECYTDSYTLDKVIPEDKSFSPDFPEVKSTFYGKFLGGEFEAHTDWTKGASQKDTTLIFENGVVFLDHTAQKAYARKDGKDALIKSFDTIEERLPLEYIRAYWDWYNVLTGVTTDNRRVVKRIMMSLEKMYQSWK